MYLGPYLGGWETYRNFGNIGRNLGHDDLQ